MGAVAVMIALAACTNDRGGLSRSSLSEFSNEPSVVAKAVACSSEELSRFEAPDVESIDLDRESLPRGLYLATLAEMLLEKKAESAPVRLLVREIPGGKQDAEIICSENVGKLGSAFEMAITGVVKFESGAASQGSSQGLSQGTNFQQGMSQGSNIITRVTSRQFYVYVKGAEHGVILSNPKTAARSTNLKQALADSGSVGQITKLDERHYLLKFTREREGVRARLLVQLELIPQPE